MQKSEATKLANVINYFTKGFQGEVWQAEVHPCYEKEWKVVVKIRSRAFRHEINALMMVVENTRFTSCRQGVDDEGEIVWKVW